MTADQFAEDLARLVGEAEDAGLELEKILAEIEGIANRGHHTICSKSHANGPFHMPVAFHHDFERGL